MRLFKGVSITSNEAMERECAKVKALMRIDQFYKEARSAEIKAMKAVISEFQLTSKE